MSGAPARGTLPRRQRRHHQQDQRLGHPQAKQQKHVRKEAARRDGALDGEPEEKRPKVNPIFLWASQCEQRIVEVRCEDYDKRNRIKLTKTAQGWRSIPRTTSNVYSIALATANACKTRSSSLDSPASSVSSNDEKENGKCARETATNSHHQRLPGRIYPANGATNGPLTGAADGTGKKKCYEDARSDENRRGYPLGVRDDSNRNAVQDCPGDGSQEVDEEKRTGEVEREVDRERGKGEDRVSSLAIKYRSIESRINLERLQKDKLFQPRVVLEQLHPSQLLESAHQNVVRQMRERKELAAATSETEQTGQTEEGSPIDGAEGKESEKQARRGSKTDIQDILNMIDATASPVLPADTPSADLPVDSTKTYEVELDEDARERQCVDKRVKKTSVVVQEETVDNAKDHSRDESITSYQTGTVQDGDNGNDDDDDEDEEEEEEEEEDDDDDDDDDDDVDVDEKPRMHEENILEDCSLDVEEKVYVDDNNILLSLKNNPEVIMRPRRVAEADGDSVNSRPSSNSLATWRNMSSEEASLEIEEEAPDEPGVPLKTDYNDSLKLLDALRNTPGLSVSVMKSAPEIGNKNLIAPPARPPSKASSSSRSPDSQAECVEKLSKSSSSSVDSPTTSGLPDNRGCTISSRNLPGLSIIIPNYRYRSAQLSTTTTTSPNTKRRVESPESTVSFNKTEPEEIKLDEFPHEEEENEDEDDCDSQVMEDLRRQRADSLMYDSMDMDYYNGHGSRNKAEDRKTPSENAKVDQLWVSSNRSSEAQAKCKYQDLEHFDEQVLEELRSRGTVVSPQPSGIPCSPASRRPSSVYLERLLPSPPCSVTCSEDVKSELRLKILASSKCSESRDYESSKERTSTRPDNQGVDLGLCRPIHSSIDRNAAAAAAVAVAARKVNRSFQERVSVPNKEMRNPGRPMSSGDIHSNLYITDHTAPKRPMSAEWSTGRHRSQVNYYQKIASQTARSHFAEHLQDTCATSSSTDKQHGHLDPASQLRELIEVAGHLIPDPLLVPRDYLPGLAAAPATEIPKLLTTRPELRLPEALTRPDLLRDPDLLVISLAHLQHVLDQGEGPVSGSQQSQPVRVSCNNNNNNNKNKNNSKGSNHSDINGGGSMRSNATTGRPKLSCKPIGTLMPAPIDLSSSRMRVNPYPPLLRVRSGLLKQEPEVSSTASSPDESQLWHPLFSSQKKQQHLQQQQQQQQQQQLLPQQQQQQQQQQKQQHQPQQQQQHISWHRTTLAS